MTRKKVLLARPNTFIVNEMKRFVQELGLEPTPLQSMDSLKDYDEKEIAGVVISTAVSSTVQEDYNEVLSLVNEAFPKTPVALATLVAFDKMSRSVSDRLKRDSKEFQLFSTDQALEQKIFNPTNDMLIIEKVNLTDKAQHDIALRAVRMFFN